MAISDYKITAEDIAKYGCVSLPDTLTGDAQENKAKFDRLVRECVANAVNAVIDHMVLVENEAQDWASAEALRVQAEAARVAAENLRVQAENDRADAETARAAAEAARVLAENLRAEAETARVSAEKGRTAAETARQTAESARNVWEAYDAAKTYVPGNKVSFNGSSYVCTAATTGHAPTDTAYWLLIAQKGADGAGADDLRRINDALDAVDPTKITTKAEPADDDGVMIADSADGSKAKRLLWSSVKEALGKLFVPLTRKVNGKTLSADVTLTGENIAVSTTDSTPISGSVKYRTNPNLLDNWYFGRPVNQRGQTELASGNWGMYFIDRWMSISPDHAYTITDDGIKISNMQHKYGQIWRQNLERMEKRTYTLSFLLKNIGLLSMTFTPSGSDYTEQTLDGGFIVSFISDDNLANPAIRLLDSTSVTVSDVTLLAAKLELGDTQTLAHKENGVWVLNEIPDFGEQLRRCQRYFVRVGPGDNSPAGIGIYRDGNINGWLPLPVEMRTIPSLSFNGNLFTVPNFNKVKFKNQDASTTRIIMYICELINSSETLSQIPYSLQCDLDSYIDISADL